MGEEKGDEWRETTERWISFLNELHGGNMLNEAAMINVPSGTQFGHRGSGTDDNMMRTKLKTRQL